MTKRASQAGTASQHPSRGTGGFLDMNQQLLLVIYCDGRSVGMIDARYLSQIPKLILVRMSVFHIISHVYRAQL